MIENIFNGSVLEKQFFLSLSPSQGRAVIANWTVGQLMEGKVEEVLGGQEFLINFKGIKVVAQSTAPLNVGQSIQAKVAQTSPQVILNLVVDNNEEPNTSTFQRSHLPSTTQGEGLAEKLGKIFSGEKLRANATVGQLLEGKVEEVLGERNFLINFKGFKIVAESTVPLNARQPIQVKVAQTSPQVILNLVMDGVDEQKALALIRSHLPSSTSLADLVEKLGKVFAGEKLYQLELAVDKTVLEKVMSSLSSLSVNKDVAGNPENLKQLVDRSGLSYEAKLKDVLLSNRVLAKNVNALADKDLKSLLLRLSQDLEKVPGVIGKEGNLQGNHPLHSLLELVNASIEKIETNQLVNYLTARNDQQVVLQIPVVLPEGIKTAELYIRSGGRGKKEKTTDDNCHIIFLLTMRNLGHLRIDAQVTEKKIGCTIQVDNRKIADFVERNLPELSRRLSELDFAVEKLSCIIKKSDSERIVPLEGFSLLEMRLVDTVA
jgi:hypothetical protein